jgi:hypothetical protein
VTPTFIPVKNHYPTRSIDSLKLIKEWRNDTLDAALTCFAECLDLSPITLIQLGCAWSKPHKAWAFPMLGPDGHFCGIRLRNVDGFKWTVSGSKQGLFAPMIPKQDIAYLPEGPTDTAALLTCGLYAIGRPNCNGGAEHLKIALQGLGIKRIVIVADNDAAKRLGPRDGYPGIEGAERLKKELRRWPSVIYMPPSPCKDVRDLLRTTTPDVCRKMIESQVNQKVWSKG